MMKKTVFKPLAFLLLWAMIGMSACTPQIPETKSCKTREEVGPSVFHLLLKMDHLSESRFLRSFVTAEELHQIARDTTLVLDSGLRAGLAKMEKEDLVMFQGQNFQDLVQKGAADSIHWSKITYKKLEFLGEEQDALTPCRLTFAYNAKTYITYPTMFFDGTNYKLWLLQGLTSPQDMSHPRKMIWMDVK